MDFIQDKKYYLEFWEVVCKFFSWIQKYNIDGCKLDSVEIVKVDLFCYEGGCFLLMILWIYYMEGFFELYFMLLVMCKGDYQWQFNVLVVN